MNLVFNEMHTDIRNGEEVMKRSVSRGYFKIRPLNGKLSFEMKGDFNSENIRWISRAMTQSKSINMMIFELDMRNVDTIDMPSMALLIISLKTLSDNGNEVSVTGLDGGKRRLAYELGMQYVSQIM